MNVLFFDCETTGKPKNYNASYEDVDNWPRVTQLAWMLCDHEGNVIDQRQNLIYPDGWEIPDEEFFRNNDMSTERCEKFGNPILTELNFLLRAKMRADVLCAHNLNFDHRVVWAEFIRAGMEPKRGMHKICTMMKSTNHCKLPGVRGYKWPKLEELYKVLFNKEIENAHDAFGDVVSLKECFFELLKLRVISLPEENSVP